MKLGCIVLILIGLPICLADPGPSSEDSFEPPFQDFRQPFAVVYNEQQARALWKVASAPYLWNDYNETLINDCMFNQLKFSRFGKDTEALRTYCSHFSDTRCTSIFAVNHRDKAIYFTTTGLAENFEEYSRDRLRPVRQLGDLLYENEVGKVHEKVYLQYDYLWNTMAFRDAWQRRHRQYPKYQFILVGHEAAGGTVKLIAYTLVSSGEVPAAKITVRTYGTPKAFAFGNSSESYTRVVKDTFHVVKKGDGMPRQPKGYRQFDNLCKEIFYSNGMHRGAPYRICAGKEDPLCSQGDANANSTVNENDAYFNSPLKTACFKDGDD